MIKNPYSSIFPKDYFNGIIKDNNKILLFIKRTIKHYLKNIYLLFSHLIAFILYKIYYKKERKNKLKNIIDIFALVDNINKDGVFNENYLSTIYKVYDKLDISYTLLLRPYNVGKNPFKLIKFFKIINKDKRDFIFEYELLGYKDFIVLFFMIIKYPFKVLNLKQKENNDIDKIYNNSIFEDISSFSFDSISRYILGKKLSNLDTIKRIYSWSEFQVIERSFNYAIRKNSSHIELIAMQFYLNYETYFNSYVDDLDYDMLSSPHRVLVNGKYYLQDRKNVNYSIGVSLRYKDVFLFEGIKKEENTLLLGSYVEADTKYMIESIQKFDNIIFKNHPSVDIKKFGCLPNNIIVSNENIYKLFRNTKLAIGTASGSSVEAVSCGISVIIIASKDYLTANPLVNYGKGKIWDIAFNKDEIEILYNKLIKYRDENKDEIYKIANWYKENFFIQPNEKNIIKTFKLDKENINK